MDYFAKDSFELSPDTKVELIRHSDPIRDAIREFELSGDMEAAKAIARGDVSVVHEIPDREPTELFQEYDNQGDEA